jgi:hypothetical protein
MPSTKEATALVEQVKTLLEAKRISIDSLSRETGLGAATIERFLKGDSQAHQKTVFERIEKAIQKTSVEQELPKSKDAFVETTASRKIFEVARLCQEFKEFSVIVAASGTGKTMALVEFARRNKNAILIQADTTFNSRVLLSEIYKQTCLGAPSTLHDAVLEIEAKLKDSGKLIIVDEAELVDHRAIELLRRVHDQAGIAVLLAGMPRLIAQLKGKRGEFAQLYGRVGFCIAVEGLSEEDTRAIVESAVSQASEQWRVFHKLAHGDARRLRKLLDRARRIAQVNHIEINENVIKSAAEMLID